MGDQIINVGHVQTFVAIKEFRGSLSDLAAALDSAEGVPPQVRAQAKAHLEDAERASQSGGAISEVKRHLDEAAGALTSAGKVAGASLALGKAVASISSALGLTP